MAEKSNAAEVQQKIEIVSPGKLVLRRFLRNKLSIVGFVILVVMAVFSFVGPLFSPYGEYQLMYQNKAGEEILDTSATDMTASGIKLFDKQPPSRRHWLGTDRDGRDILTRLMFGGRISLLIGIAGVLIQIALGMVVGGIAGYYGKKIDFIIMRIVDIIFCIPTMPIILIISSIMIALKIPQEYRIYMLILMIGFLGWSGVARMVRGQILSLREQEYMVAAEAAGLKVRRRILRHLLPNVMPQLIVIATLGIGSIILWESSLSFLGLGVPLPLASWGNMVQVVTDMTVLRRYLFMWVPPGVAVLLTVMAFNFVGDGLRDAFDPKMKR